MRKNRRTFPTAMETKRNFKRARGGTRSFFHAIAAWAGSVSRLSSGLFLLLAPLSVPTTSLAADASIVNALLKLSTLNGNVSNINGRLYAGFINSQITHTGSTSVVLPNDTMFLHVADPNRPQLSVDCGSQQAQVTKTVLDACVSRNVNQLVQILFPSSISSSVSGSDAAQNQSELFLLTTALGAAAPSRETTRRNNIGGLFEYERFSGNQTSGQAWQGLYQLQAVPISVHSRYAKEDDTVKTWSVSTTIDVHPSFRLNSALDWRVGGDAYTGFVYSRSSPVASSGLDPLQLGSIDFGGGPWTSVRKDFSRVRVGASSQFLLSKSHVPSLAGDEFTFVTNAMNDRPVAYDIAYGGLVGFLTSARTSLNGKFIETHAIASDVTNAAWPRPTARLGMVAFSYLIGGNTPIDFGYKVSTGSGVTGHSVFVLGNFRW
jgi:hypothetical protein